jgi:uncharacterized protein YciI
MIKEYDGAKRTPTQFAKLIIQTRLENAFYWEDGDDYAVEGMTDREKAEVHKAVEKLHARCMKALGKMPSQSVDNPEI